jgi:FecR protein
MTHPSCDRSWQVEAARDGRLEAAALAAFELHQASCPTCQAERKSLATLALKLEEIGSHVDEMAMRRLRQRTLERANDLIVRSDSPKQRVRTIGWTLVACVAVAAVVLFWLGRPRPFAATQTAVLVEAEQNAQWHRQLEANVEQVDLSAGTLRFRVARKATDPRLLVRVPDGEIEDLGTTFSVTVQDGRTTEIVVREGRVLFHRRGAAALHLIAGSTWTPPAEVTQKKEPSVVLDTSATAKSVKAEPPMEKPKPVAPPSPSAASTNKPAPAAQAASEAGNREDAAYLQILALLREGRTDEARLAAFAYLRLFPEGFRTVEVSRVAALQGPDASTEKTPE